MDVLFNNRILLHDDGERVLYDDWASWYMDNQLNYQLTEDGANVLQLIPDKLPLANRLKEKTERILYQVKFDDRNQTEEFVTKVLHTCETMNVMGKRSGPLPRCKIF